MLAGALAVVVALLIVNAMPARTRGQAAPVGGAVAHAPTPGEAHAVISKAGEATTSRRPEPTRGRPAGSPRPAPSTSATALPAPESPQEGGAGGSPVSEVDEFGFER
jgi:hypothetical protein